ncbi:MAG: riboflavin synthase [Alphaproteobacteria bacterium]|nr:riboflavin synthase [Alphaproteobacteria bacterium]
MFTGLVEEIGTVTAAGPRAGGYRISIGADATLGDIELGASIAVNGVCLTVEAFTDEAFTVGLAPETLSRTNLGELRPGAPVNLERAALPTTRLGGHYVQGHVDGVGVIESFRPDADALWLKVALAPELLRYIAPKGYVAIDGASLTIVNVGGDWFDVTLISYSQEKLILPRKKPGDRVNIEVDMLAKYVERLAAPAIAGARGAVAQ